MKSEDVGSVPIVEDDRLVGMVTDRDITIRAVAEGKDLQSTTVGEIASRDVVTVDPQQSLDEAARLMAQHQVRRAAGRRGGRPARRHRRAGRRRAGGRGLAHGRGRRSGSRSSPGYSGRSSQPGLVMSTIARLPRAPIACTTTPQPFVRTPSRTRKPPRGPALTAFEIGPPALTSSLTRSPALKFVPWTVQRRQVDDPERRAASPRLRRRRSPAGAQHERRDERCGDPAHRRSIPDKARAPPERGPLDQPRLGAYGVTFCTITWPEPTRRFVSVRTSTVPASTRPAAGASSGRDRPRHRPRAPGRPERVRVRDADRPERRRLREDVDVVVRRRAGRHVEPVHAHEVRRRHRVVQRDRLLRVTVGRLAHEHAGWIAPEHEQVQVGSRVGRAADRRAELRRPGRDDRLAVLHLVVRDRERPDACAPERGAHGPTRERAEHVRQRVRACDRHADRRRRDDVRVRRHGRAEDRPRQRERREGGVGRPAGVDCDLPHTGLRVGDHPARRAAGRARGLRRDVALGDGVRVDRETPRVPAQEPDLTGARRGRGGRREVDLERRRAGRDTEEVVQLLSASDRAAHRRSRSCCRC